VAEARAYSVAEFWTESTLPVADDRSWQILNAVVQRFKGEKFICGPSGGEIGIVMLGGITRGSMMLLEQPQVVRAATAFLLRRQNLADEVLVHPDADGVLWDADFGDANGSFVSPEVFREFFVDANRDRVCNLHEKHGKKVLKHCCGNVRGLLDQFVEIGYDAYQSIQPSAGMDLCEVETAYGDQITLWGGVAVEHLVSGGPDQVREDVRRAMACAKSGGRFILGTSHSVAVGTKYENYMAMLDEYHKLCEY
jgi:uroporphyrinogen-III decarboxylase